MPFSVVRNDLVKMKADAIVNTANPNPLFGRGTDYAVYKAAGRKELLEARKKIGKIDRGEAAITPAFRLQARYIIHTVGPYWKGGGEGEAYILRACYENCLCLARQYGCESIAFPLISTGGYGFPKDRALQIMLDVVSRFLEEEEMMIWLVIFDQKTVSLSVKMFESIESLIDGHYVRKKSEEEYGAGFLTGSKDILSQFSSYEEPMVTTRLFGDWKQTEELGGMICQMEEETFQQMLFRLIAEKGMSNANVYKKANQDKKLFSKIKHDVNYQPRKKTALAFALALELNLGETKRLLERAGYTFSPGSVFDRVIQYCIETRKYNIYEIEIILHNLGLETLCNY